MISTTLPRSRSRAGIAYHHCGDGPPILLLHGVGLRAESWLLQIAALRDTHSLFAIDLPGHGHSSHIDQQRPKLADFTDRVAAFVDEIIGQPVIVIGHSMGAMIALDLARRRPSQCVGVAALNAVYRRTPEARQAVKDRAQALAAANNSTAPVDDASNPIARWFDLTSPDQTQLAELVRNWLGAADRQGYAVAYEMFAREDGPSEQALRGLLTPAFFVTGASDPNSTPAMTRAMAAIAPGGHALVLEGARHMAMLTHPKPINAALAELSAACAPPRSVTQ